MLVRLDGVPPGKVCSVQLAPRFVVLNATPEEMWVTLSNRVPTPIQEVADVQLTAPS